MNKEYKKQYDREYYLKNLEKKKVNALKYALEHKSDKKEYDKKYRLINSDKVLVEKAIRKASGKSYIEARRSMLKRKYNISLEEYDNMLLKQEGKCKICGSIKSEHKSSVLYVDHCHTTGNIRGLLCHHCNYGLGGFRDNQDFLLSAINYLKEYQNKTN